MNRDQVKSLLPGVPLVESPFFDDIVAGSDFDAETARIGKDLNENGFACFKFPDPQIAERADRIRRDLAARFDLESWRRTGCSHGESLRVCGCRTPGRIIRMCAPSPTTRA
jgi:hypothetical protein